MNVNKICKVQIWIYKDFVGRFAVSRSYFNFFERAEGFSFT